MNLCNPVELKHGILLFLYALILLPGFAGHDLSTTKPFILTAVILDDQGTDPTLTITLKNQSPSTQVIYVFPNLFTGTILTKENPILVNRFEHADQQERRLSISAFEKPVVLNSGASIEFVHHLSEFVNRFNGFGDYDRSGSLLQKWKQGLPIWCSLNVSQPKSQSFMSCLEETETITSHTISLANLTKLIAKEQGKRPVPYF